MIRFALKCANDHSFESWFASNAKFEELQATGQVACPRCNNAEVVKELMAPPVRASRKRVRPAPAQPMAASPDPNVAEAINAIRIIVSGQGDWILR